MLVLNAICLAAVATTLAACSNSGGEPADDAVEAAGAGDDSLAQGPMPVEPDGGIGDGAPPLGEVIAQQETGGADTPTGLAKSFPTAIRGKWRSTDDGAVTAKRCDGYDQDNMGKVLTVRADSYSFFEEGGRFIRVTARDAGRIRAVFDTTYADEPTRDELEFRVDPVARTLTVENFDTGEQGTTVYRRCPRDEAE